MIIQNHDILVSLIGKTDLRRLSWYLTWWYIYEWPWQKIARNTLTKDLGVFAFGVLVFLCFLGSCLPIINEGDVNHIMAFRSVSKLYFCSWKAYASKLGTHLKHDSTLCSLSFCNCSPTVRSFYFIFMVSNLNYHEVSLSGRIIKSSIAYYLQLH